MGRPVALLASAAITEPPPGARLIRLRGLPDGEPHALRRVSAAALDAWLGGQADRPALTDAPPPRRAEDIRGLPRDSLLVVSGLAPWSALPARLAVRPDVSAIAVLTWPSALDWPEYAAVGAGNAARTAIEGALSTAALIVVEDQATAERLSALRRPASTSGIVVAAWPSGLSAVPGPTPRFAHAEPYVVAAGPIEARANSLLLLQLWRDGLARGLPLPRLVLAGPRGPLIEEIAPLLDWNAALRARVAEAPGLPAEALRALVAGAQALLAPDFAAPPRRLMRDALACGVPVIAADTPEAEGLGLDPVLSPIDGPGWRRAVLAVTAGPPAARPQPVLPDGTSVLRDLVLRRPAG